MDTKSRVSFASRLIRANFLSAHDTVGEVMQTYRADLLVCVLVCVLTDPDSSCRVILITEEPQCLAAH